MATYNQVIDTFRDLSTRHKQINTFFSGEEYDFQSASNIYPALLLSPDVSSVSQGSIMLKFNMYVIDILNRDRLNNDDIKSDTLQIGLDIISVLYDNSTVYGFTIEDETSITPLNEEMDDIISGWVFSINVQIQYAMSDCYLPINNQ